ncbi:MAG: hypothetical protein JSW66_07120, partial [Phycisphaerales bacterium]
VLDYHDDGSEEATCNHENDCMADPCFQIFRNDENTSTLLAYTTNHEFIVVAQTSTKDFPVKFCEADEYPSNSHHQYGRPFPDRAIPLLI